MTPPKLFRITTVPVSLKILLKGQLRFMSHNGYEVTGISSGGEELREVKENEGVRIISVEMTRTISPVKDLKAVWELYRIFRKEKPFIVHTHTPKAGTVGMLAAKLAGVPHRLHTVAGLPLLVTTGNKRKLLDWVEKLTYFNATKVYPNSFGLREIILQNKYASEHKLKVIGKGSSNGIDTDYFNPELFSEDQVKQIRLSINIPPEDFVFVFVGRIVADKGLNELVLAFSIIQSENKNAKLLLVGNFERELDPLLPEVEKEIEDNPNIVFVGYHADVRPYLAMSDSLVFPSYREGFPNVVMQAGAMGLVSIVTDINGCNEIVQENINGFIVSVKNQAQLQEKMRFLLQNPDKKKEMAANCRKQIVDNYERTYIWNEILKEYKSL